MHRTASFDSQFILEVTHSKHEADYVGGGVKKPCRWKSRRAGEQALRYVFKILIDDVRVFNDLK
jgi:hypothetical protein